MTKGFYNHTLVSNMLQVNNIYAGYGKFHVLKGVTLSAQKGQIIALIGPNGAGKSTVLKAIYNLLPLDSGSILYKKRSITKLQTNELIKKGIVFVNQGKIIFDTLTIKENLEIAMQKPNQKLLHKAYQKFPQLKQRENNFAYGLSGGQRQMLALARALVQKPKLLLLDEPSLGLSPKLQSEVFSTILELRKEGMTIIIVEQNAKKAIEIADKTYLLENGKIVLKGGKDILKHEMIKAVYLGG